ncbi:MAG: glycoside hydrolase family 16 protein [Clostridia bacterium]|nr:glycoside hydrolase family 16 protein [Clostridia bacterium]
MKNKEMEECKAIRNDYDENNLTYELVWSDEFNYEGLPDPAKWAYDVGVHFNNELQYYTGGENTEVKDGRLVIKALKEQSNGYKYTSSRLVTRHKGDWLYGKFEISAKLPSGTGTWPAIWMLPTDAEYGRWPASGEIDIMEHVGYNQNQIHFSAHTLEFNHTKRTEITAYTHVDDVSEKFHKYSLEWLPDKLRFMVDDREYFKYKPTDLVECPQFIHWPFDQKFHLVLNIAVGGFWGGKNGVDDSIFPQEMTVDYVRVYQAKELKDR